MTAPFVGSSRGDRTIRTHSERILSMQRTAGYGGEKAEATCVR